MYFYRAMWIGGEGDLTPVRDAAVEELEQRGFDVSKLQEKNGILFCPEQEICVSTIRVST